MDASSIAEQFASLEMVLLMVLFGGVVYWAFRKKRRDRSGGGDHRDD